MGRSIDLYSYDKEKLINNLALYCKTEDKPLIKKILSKFGTFIHDRYVILNQDFWEDYDCFFNLTSVIDRVFKAENSVDVMIEWSGRWDSGKKELIRSVDEDEVMEELFGEDYDELYPEIED